MGYIECSEYIAKKATICREKNGGKDKRVNNRNTI